MKPFTSQPKKKKELDFVLYPPKNAQGTEAGQPRPRSHNEPHKVTVGNFDVEAAPGGGSMIRVSAIVDNVAKGAWGNALEITKRVVKACATNTKW